MTTFFFRAVAADGKLRTGRLAGETDKYVARELRKQGLTPVYVGTEPKKSYELKLPAFATGRRRDVLFFTQEMSTLLNAGVPLDRALAITAELTERPSFRAIVLDVLRVLKGGKPLADSLATHGEYFSDLFVNMVRAGEASGALAVVFERLSEFEHSRDELRNYIVSAMIYPALLCLVGLASVIILLTFVVPRFASLFEDSHMQMPLPTQIMLEASNIVQTWWWVAALAVAIAVGSLRFYIGRPKGRLRWDRWRLQLAAAGRCLTQSRDVAFRPRHGYADLEHRAAGAGHRHLRRRSEQPLHRPRSRRRFAGRQARRRHCRAHRQIGRLPAVGRPPVDGGRRNRQTGFDVHPHGGHL